MMGAAQLLDPLLGEGQCPLLPGVRLMVRSRRWPRFDGVIKTMLV